MGLFLSVSLGLFVAFRFADYIKPQNNLLEFCDVSRLSTNIETINEVRYHEVKFRILIASI